MFESTTGSCLSRVTEHDPFLPGHARTYPCLLDAFSAVMSSPRLTPPVPVLVTGSTVVPVSYISLFRLPCHPTHHFEGLVPLTGGPRRTLSSWSSLSSSYPVRSSGRPCSFGLGPFDSPLEVQGPPHLLSTPVVTPDSGTSHSTSSKVFGARFSPDVCPKLRYVWVDTGNDRCVGIHSITRRDLESEEQKVTFRLLGTDREESRSLDPVRDLELPSGVLYRKYDSCPCVPSLP